jgi:hypothetical protein
VDAGTTTTLDQDGDGFAGWYEVSQGTDPADSDSFPVLGDVDGSGVTDVSDAVLLFNYVIDNTEETGEWSRGDVNVDTVLDVCDPLIIYRWALKTPGMDVLPASQP